MFSSDNALYLYTSSGAYENIYSDAQYSSYATVRSPFTDLAGNSIADGWSATGFNGNSYIYVDTVAPEYSETNISGSMMKGEGVTSDQDDWPEDIDRSQVFAGAGDTITFSSTFSEEVGVDPSQVTAVLNIKNGSGNVTVRGASSEAVSTGVNSNIKVTRITFEPITITEGMVPEDDGQAIRIKALELPSGAADLCGNEFASRSMEIQDSPRQQEWLDTVAPDLTTLLQPNTEGAYAPYTETTYYGGDESRTADGFYFPVQINDGSYDIGCRRT